MQRLFSITLQNAPALETNTLIQAYRSTALLRSTSSIFALRSKGVRSGGKRANCQGFKFQLRECRGLGAKHWRGWVETPTYISLQNCLLLSQPLGPAGLLLALGGNSSAIPITVSNLKNNFLSRFHPQGKMLLKTTFKATPAFSLIRF